MRGLQLQRAVIDYRTGELSIRVLYRRSLEEAPGPNTKARAREAQDLTREGLTQALEALDGDVTMAGTSGFSTREDILLATASPSARQPMRKGA